MSASKYEYCDLLLSEDSPSIRIIRLLKIEAAADAEPIRAHLTRAILNPNLGYVALSYVWGTDEPTYDLFIGD